jgi:hypothetical protein
VQPLLYLHLGLGRVRLLSVLEGSILHELIFSGWTWLHCVNAQVEGCPRGRQLQWGDLSLPFFNAVLRESMRLHPVGGDGTGR